MRCPQCDIAMSEVMARANPGSLIQLDQCRKCGGLWCDKWELFPIDPLETEHLETVDEQLLAAPVQAPKRALYCPRCTAKLQVLKDPMLPSEIQLTRCVKCDGIWLNRGQLSRYKKHQLKIRSEKLGPAGIIKRIEEVYQDPKAWVVTGTRGIYAYPRGMDEDDVVEKTARGGFKLVLQTLLRMVLG